MGYAIKCENISKCYQIDHIKSSNKTLRESLTSSLQNLLQPGKNPKTEEFWALKDISLEIAEGDRIGIVGRNGAGKSTLLKIFSRITMPTTGTAKIRGKVSSLLEVGTGFHPELTGRENVFLSGTILGMERNEIKRKFDEIVDFSGIEKFIDTPVKRYSSGMYLRLAFSVSAHLEPDILILDEVLAVGDAQFQEKCIKKMRDITRKNRTLLFVSHSISNIASLCQKGMILTNGTTEGLVPIDEVINKYYNNTMDSEVIFENNSVVTRAAVEQIGQEIMLEVDYYSEDVIAYPNLGFTIHDSLGNPICSANLNTCPPDTQPQSAKEGAVRAFMENPLLLDGIYRISISFSDGFNELFYEQECIAFKIAGMVKTIQGSANELGHVLPVCYWEFDKIK